jgi:hypothetical protein
MTIFAADVPSTILEKPLSEAEQNAILWHADQELTAALKAGVVMNEEEGKQVWESACYSVLEDPELLTKMVKAYRKNGNNKNFSSKRVVMDHEAALAAEGKDLPHQLAQETDRSHMLTFAGAAVLSLAAGHFRSIAMQNQFMSPSQMVGAVTREPQDDMPELPQRRGVEVVEEPDPKWEKRHRKRKKPASEQHSL